MHLFREHCDVVYMFGGEVVCHFYQVARVLCCDLVLAQVSSNGTSKLTFVYLSVHDAKDALCDSFVDEVIAVRWPAHLPMVCFQADLFELTWKI